MSRLILPLLTLASSLETELSASALPFGRFALLQQSKHAEAPVQSSALKDMPVAPVANASAVKANVSLEAKESLPTAGIAAALPYHEAELPKLPRMPSRMACSFSFAVLVKVLCMLSNVACHVSPLPQVQQFHKLGDTGEQDSAPFMSILYSGSQWVFYGTFAYWMTGNSGFLVLVYANITGAVLGVYYVWGFQNNCRDQKALRQLQFYCRAAAMMVLLQFLAMMSLTSSSALFCSGLMSSLSSIISASSLCSTLPKVIKTQSSASINVELLVVGICSSVLWVTCGMMLWDKWILLPTLFGLVIQLACASFLLLFPREERAWDSCEHLEDPQRRARRALEDYGACGGAGTGGTG